MQEQALFPQIAAGDPGAFRTLYEQYQGKIYGAAMKWTRSVAAAEEITQEVFVQLWVSRSRLTGVRNPEAYLYASVYYKISHHLKQEKNRQRIMTIAMEAATGVSNETAEAIDYADRRRTIRQALDQLSPQKKAIYLLKQDFGHSNSEIGMQLNLSPHTVKSHMAQAVKFLRHYLQHTALLCSILYPFF